jgi:hypothetical protein
VASAAAEGKGGIKLVFKRVLPASLRKAAGIKISLGPGGGGQRFGLFQAG